MATGPATTARRQRGTTLLEALIAFLVLSLGMLAIARMQSHLRVDADLARQRSEAIRLAQEEIETLRAFSTISASPGARSFDGIANASRSVSGIATYALIRQIEPIGRPRAKAVSVTVSWTDSTGTPQHIELHTLISGSDPALGAALSSS